MIEHLTLKKVRIYDALDLEPHPTLNILVGDNAQGKTTVLEAIHMLALAKSHKPAKDTDIMQTGADFAHIEARCAFDGRPLTLSLTLTKNGKKAKYNKIEMERLSDYVGNLNVVMFAPEDLDLIKGSPRERRRFLDVEIGQLSKAYLMNLGHYRRLLRERNEVLKGLAKNTKFDHRVLDVITEQLAHYGEKIVAARESYLKILNERVQETLAILAPEDPLVTLTYAPSTSGDLITGYRKKTQFDLITQSTQLGPHRDDIRIDIDETPFKQHASQGQIRTLALALKLAVATHIEATKKRPPIVLLDDVLSELDKTRQTTLLNSLPDKTQLFITTTHIDHISTKENLAARVFTIHGGAIEGVTTHG